MLAVALAVGSFGCARQAVDDKKSFTRIELAKDFLRRNELEAAELEARKGLEHDPGNADGEYILGLVSLLRAGSNLRLVEVDDCLTGVDAQALRSESDAHLASAEAHFARAVELDPEHAEAWANRGQVADLLGDPRTAIAHYEQALAFPHRLLDVGVIRANLGMAHFHADDLVRAAKELRQAIQFNPAMCLAHFRLGRVYYARQEWAKAAEQFRLVVNDRTCPMQEAHLYLLLADKQLGAAEEAERTRGSCVALATKSCIAARCRAVP